MDSILPNTRILLFGSQAKGTANKHSDYDVVVLTKRKLSTKKMREVWPKLNRELVWAMDAPVDLIVKSEVELRIGQTLPGHILKTAIREGIFI